MSDGNPHAKSPLEVAVASQGPAQVSICGLRITSDISLSASDDEIEPDGACAVAFGSQLPSGCDWLTVGGWRLSLEGRHAVAEETGVTCDLRAMQVRQVAPFAAALQNKLTLHASCVASPGGAYAFVGESGAGKSTFAATLLRKGFRRLCDDLLPVRPLGGRWIVPAVAGALPLERIYFLERGPATASLAIDRLSPRDALMNLLQHGFGELHATRIWGYQFEGYSRIAKAVPCFRLVVPHGLTRLPEYAEDWAGSAARDAR